MFCDSTDYRHIHEDHKHGPDTEYANHISASDDAHNHTHEDSQPHNNISAVSAYESEDAPLPAPSLEVQSPPVPVIAPTPVRPSFRQLSSAEFSGRRTPVAAGRISSFASSPRVATPTQARPFGSLMNGTYMLLFNEMSCLCLANRVHIQPPHSV